MATYESKKYRTIPINAEQIADESVTNTEFQRLNGVTGDIQTQIGNLDTSKLPKAGGTLTGDLNLGDNVDINVGTGTDLKILHDGTNSILNNQTGTLKVQGDTVQFRNAADNATFLTINSSSGVLSEQNYKATISTNNPSGGSNGDVWYKYS